MTEKGWILIFLCVVYDVHNVQKRKIIILDLEFFLFDSFRILSCVHRPIQSNDSDLLIFVQIEWAFLLCSNSIFSVRKSKAFYWYFHIFLFSSFILWFTSLISILFPFPLNSLIKSFYVFFYRGKKCWINWHEYNWSQFKCHLIWIVAFFMNIKCFI